MSGVDAVGTGHPDGEVRAMPHGAMLLTGSALAVAAGGTNIPGISGFLEIAAYRSLVVQVKNSGANDVTITPRWNFFDGASAINAEDVQTVPAGTSKRLLFQNLGDIVNRVRAAGVGGASTIDYYVTGSNLDPLAVNAPDFLILTGFTTNIIDPPIGDSDHGKFNPTPVWTNKVSDWSFDLDAGGKIKIVHAAKAGLYYACVNWIWQASAGVVDKTVSMDATPNTNETFNSPNFLGTSAFSDESGATEVAGSLSTWAAWHSGGGYFDVNVGTNLAGGVLFNPAYLFIVKFPLAG